jgi:hypothetical protein
MGSSFVLYILFPDFICDGSIQAFLVCRLLFDLNPGKLVCMMNVVSEWEGLLPMKRDTLSNLSTVEEMVRIFSAGTPHTSKMPSKILR